MSDANDDSTIFTEVGRCLSEWSKVEWAIAALFCVLHDQRLAANAKPLIEFEAIRGFDRKRKELRKKVRSLPWTAGPFRDAHRIIHKELCSAALLRNQVAHFSIVRTYDRLGPPAVSLAPYYSFSGEYLNGHGDRLSPADLRERATSFLILAERAFRMVTYVINTRGLLDKHDKAVSDTNALLRFPFEGERRDVVIVG